MDENFHSFKFNIPKNNVLKYNLYSIELIFKDYYEILI